MKKRLLTAMVVIATFTLGACQEDPLMDEIKQGVELNQELEPSDNDEDEEGVPPPV